MTDTTTIIRLCRERAAQYGAVRGSSLTAIALDRAADALEDALGMGRPPAQVGVNDTSSRTNAEVLEQANDLARRFYARRGYEVPGDYRFQNATHPHEVEAWDMAVLAMEVLTDTDARDAADDEVVPPQQPAASGEECSVPSCDTTKTRGICDACDALVDGEVAALTAPSAPATDPGDMNDYMEAIDASRPRQPPAGQDAAVERVMILVDEYLCLDQLPTAKCNELADLIAAAIAPQTETDRKDPTS